MNTCCRTSIFLFPGLTLDISLSQSLSVTITVGLRYQFWIETKGTNCESALCHFHGPIGLILVFSLSVRGGRVSYQVTSKIKKGFAEDNNILLTARNRVELEAARIQSRLDTSNLIASIQYPTNFSRLMARTLTMNFIPEGTDPNFCITKK